MPKFKVTIEEYTPPDADNKYGSVKVIYIQRIEGESVALVGDVARLLNPAPYIANSYFAAFANQSKVESPDVVEVRNQNSINS